MKNILSIAAVLLVVASPSSSLAGDKDKNTKDVDKKEFGIQYDPMSHCVYANQLYQLGSVLQVDNDRMVCTFRYNDSSSGPKGAYFESGGNTRVFN